MLELHSISDHCTLAGYCSQPNSRGVAAIKMACPIQEKEKVIELHLRAMIEWKKKLKLRMLSLKGEIYEQVYDLI